MRRRRGAGLLAATVLLPIALGAPARAASSATSKPTTSKRAASKTAPNATTSTRVATTVATTKKVATTRPPKLTGEQATAYCRTATDVKATLTELRSKRQQLGSRTPADLYNQEIAAGKKLADASPSQLHHDFDVIADYLALFVQLASTKDSKKLAVISAKMGADDTLSAYLDATIHIEGFVRRTCGFPVGI